MNDLCHVTYAQLAAELRRRAREYEALLTANNSGVSMNSYNPEWPGVLRRMAKRLEAMGNDT